MQIQIQIQMQIQKTQQIQSQFLLLNLLLFLLQAPFSAELWRRMVLINTSEASLASPPRVRSDMRVFFTPWTQRIQISLFKTVRENTYFPPVLLLSLCFCFTDIINDIVKVVLIDLGGSELHRSYCITAQFLRENEMFYEKRT